MVHGCREFLHTEHEAAIAAYRHDGLVRMSNFHAQCRVKAEAEVVLVTTSDEVTRLINRKSETRGKSDLRNFLDEETVARQNIANNVEVVHLRLDGLDSF